MVGNSASNHLEGQSLNKNTGQSNVTFLHHDKMIMYNV